MRNLFGSLFLGLSLVAGFAHASAAEPVAGKDYEVLKMAHPTSAPPGKVEVIEFFWYRSPACYKLEPTIEAFVKQEGDRILFKRVQVDRYPLRHAPGAPDNALVPYSKFYYSLVQLGLEEKLMLAVYKKILTENELLSEREQADFLATQGVDKPKFIDAYESFTVESLVEQGDKLFGDYYNDIHSLISTDQFDGHDTMPIFVVAGRYTTPSPFHTRDLGGVVVALVPPGRCSEVLDYLVKQVLDKKL
jgi:protein dithiol oxidoreductase (disulfide-forming)